MAAPRPASRLFRSLALCPVRLAGQEGTDNAGHFVQMRIETVAGHAVESGMSRARSFAEDWVARLQGALILQAVNGDAGPFKRAMNDLLALAKEDASRA